jgi:hypothetical protein
MVEDIPQLVDLTALHERRVAEGLADRLSHHS